MSEVLKWFEDNIYYSVNSGNATFSIQNEDLWEFEELLKKQNRELQQKENIIKEARELVKNECWGDNNSRCVDDLIYYKCDELLEILDKVEENK